MAEAETARRPPLRWGLLVLLVLAGLAGGLMWAAYTGLFAAERAPTPPIVVAVEAIQPRASFEVSRTFVGRIEGRRRSRVGFELAGTVTRVSVDEGERVAPGGELARLDTARLEARRREAAARLAEAEADVWLAERSFRRRRDVGEPAFSQEVVDEARHALERARARVEGGRARLGRIDVDLDKSKLRAPFAAVVTERLVDEGDVVAVGTPALVLLEAAAPEVRIGLSGGVARRLERCGSCVLRIAGEHFPAELRAVVPTRDLDARTVDALFRLDATWDEVNEGDLVRLDARETVNERGAWVPISALTEGVRGLFAVFVAVPRQVGERFVAERREVEVLHQTASRAFVRGGLEQGALVVSKGAHKLVPGLPVRIAQRPELDTPSGS